MHDYDPPDLSRAVCSSSRPAVGSGAPKNNTFAMNEQNICTGGVGPSPNSPQLVAGIGEAGQGRRHYARQEEDMRLRILVAVSALVVRSQPERPASIGGP